MKIRILTVAAAITALTACGYDDGTIVGIDGNGPEDLTARFEWVAEGWPNGEAVGHPAVQVTWNLSRDWAGEPFRVYSRESGTSDYFLVATVTSCASEASGFFDCQYTDLNVEHGESYDYFVAAVDERTGEEFESSTAVRVETPAFDPPGIPQSLEVTTLDGSLFLQWSASTEGEVWKYLVFLTGLDGETTFYQVGETDGGVFLDERAENGFEYEYRVAAVDTFGQASDLSGAASGIPRPDFHAELLYSMEDRLESSGFRFVSSGGANPVVAGNSTDAQFHVTESLLGGLSLVPDGETGVTAGVFTTSLACAGDAEPDCVDVEVASGSAAAYGTSPVLLQAGYTYALRVVGDDGQVHFGKIRVQGSGSDATGDDYLVFDWAYQTVAGEVRLNLGG